jgi:acyl carrier protein
MTELRRRIREYVADHLRERAARFGVDLDTIEGSFNLLESGVLDSLGFVELMVAVEQEFDVVMRFDDMDPADFTTVEGFVRCASGTERTE